MKRVRHFNPVAVGISGTSIQSDEDYFYREILISDQAPTTTNENDEGIEVDCVGGVNAPGAFDELFLVNPAENCAQLLVKLLNRSEEAQSFLPAELSEEAESNVLQENMQPEAQVFLQIFLKFIDNQRLVDASSYGISGGASIFYTQTMKNANRLRESLRICNKSDQSMLITVHTWLLRNLSTAYLASYLNLLRFLKNAGSNLGDYVTKSNNESELKEANKCISEFLVQKLYEPPLGSTSKLFECEPIKNVSLVLVYPQISTKICKHIIRAHETLFRNLLPLTVCCVERVELNLDVDYPISVQECTWMCIKQIRQSVREIAKRRPNDHIFLVGWGTTCWLNHKAVFKVPYVSGLLNFAFPTESPCGSRGGVDDRICLTYPSTLFVVGENGQNVNMNALMKLRRNMLADSGLIVIGGANNDLMVSPTILSIERISQFVIHKQIVECSIQFIKQVVTDLGPPKECRQFLLPIKVPNIYEIDSRYFKPKAPFRHLTKIASNLPIAPSLKSATEQKLTGGDSLKIPSPETLNRQILRPHLTNQFKSSNAVIPESLREEEEAAAALASLK